MLNYLSSFFYNEDDEIKPDERQVHLRHLLHRQIILNNMVLKSPEAKPSTTDELINYELEKIRARIPIKKRLVKKRKYFK